MRELSKTIRNLLQEAISLDVKPGDVILTGRFKNKRRIVKSIGTDKFGQPTINGKSILKFKIEKKMPKKKWSAQTRAELKERKGEPSVKLLRKTIRKLIIESACDNTNAVISNAIQQCKKRNIKFFIDAQDRWDKSTTVEMYLAETIDGQEYYELIGQLTAGEQEVKDVYVTGLSVIRGGQYRSLGLGALLYDLAMESVTEHGGWFTCDGEEVSSFAMKMWRFFMSSSNYEQKQLDLAPTEEGYLEQEHFLTPTQDDDAYRESFMSGIMGQYSEDHWKKHFAQHATPEAQEGMDGMVSDNWHFYDPSFKEDYLASPMTKAYRKASLSTIECLRAEGLFMKEEDR